MIAPGAAQEAAPVTDTELRAAYCLGVATAQLETLEAEYVRRKALGTGRPRSLQDDIEVKLEDEARKVATERRDRIRGYLAAKGFLGRRTVRDIQIALLRGPIDVKACIAELDDNVACFHECGPVKTTEQGRRCDMRCGADACIRVKRCIENFLPF